MGINKILVENCVEKIFHGTVCGKSSAVTGLERSSAFQEVKVPRFHENGTGWW
jgi:hypothetical protein